MSDPIIDISIAELTVAADVQELTVEVVGSGPQGPAGATGPQGPADLYDSSTPPVSSAFPYLRFIRDMAGDVQEIRLGTTS